MKKNGRRILLILLSPVILLPSLLLLAGCDPYTLLFLSMMSRPDPPMPEITSAEFPFKLVYTIDGKEVVYEDVITCTFGGFNNDASRSDKYRVWKKEYGKDPSYIILCRPSDDQIVYFAIQYSAAYLMGDYPDAVNYDDDPPFVGIATQYERHNGEIGYFLERTIEEDELKEVYNIEIVSFEMPPPIENTFIPVE